jgi:A/G-specific adenine glycosylase
MPDSAFAADILDWGRPRLRDLPWRLTRDPWAILVSEVMLQQTRVARVERRWQPFLDRFPTAASCASNSLAEVLREWQGLGYPRRAKHLHESAALVGELGGFPNDLPGLLRLPGIGQYTARAILVFAFEMDAAVVETNIARLYARVAGETLTPKAVQQIADETLPAGQSWIWNQCLMDLGAVLCRPRNPGCSECPVASHCAWQGAEAPDPAVGSSGVSVKQARFEGSDRQARGRLMKALTEGPIARTTAAEVMGRSAQVADELVVAIEHEGLCQTDRLTIRLPS